MATPTPRGTARRTNQPPSGQPQPADQIAHDSPEGLDAGRAATPALASTAGSEPEETQKAQASSHQRWDLRETIRDGAKHQLARQKTRATETLTSISTAARHTTRQLRDEGQANVASAVEQAVDRVDTLARSLEGTEIEDIFRGVQTFARQQPTLFVAMAFGLGVVAARFLKSSANGPSMYQQA